MVTENGCSSEDEVSIAIQPLPIFDLGPDQQLCPDEEAYFYIYPCRKKRRSVGTPHYQPALTTSNPGVYTALVNGMDACGRTNWSLNGPHRCSSTS